MARREEEKRRRKRKTEMKRRTERTRTTALTKIKEAGREHEHEADDIKKEER